MEAISAQGSARTKVVGECQWEAYTEKEKNHRRYYSETYLHQVRFKCTYDTSAWLFHT